MLMPAKRSFQHRSNLLAEPLEVTGRKRNAVIPWVTLCPKDRIKGHYIATCFTTGVAPGPELSEPEEGVLEGFYTQGGDSHRIC